MEFSNLSSAPADAIQLRVVFSIHNIEGPIGQVCDIQTGLIGVHGKRGSNGGTTGGLRRDRNIPDEATQTRLGIRVGAFTQARFAGFKNLNTIITTVTGI